MENHSQHIPKTTDTKALAITGWLTGIYFFIELGVGFWTGSVSVTSDAFHTFSAVGGVLIALAAGKLATREADPRQTFGLMRAEIVGALFNGLFLVGMAIVVIWMGVMRLLNPITLHSAPMLLIAFGGLVTEAVSFYLLYSRQKGNLNIKGAFWHILQTLVGSLIIIISAVVIRFTGFMAIDPILGMAFGLVLFWASWSITKSALDILLERTPKEINLNAIISDIERIGGVVDVHHIHAWSLTSGRNILSAHVRIDNARESERVLRGSHELLKNKYNIYFSTLQVEHACLDEGAEEIDIRAPHDKNSIHAEHRP